MPAKTIQLSTRVTQEDADFLASLSIEGAHTPSDKLRALIDEARRRRQGLHEYAAALKHVAELTNPGSQRIREIENAGLGHSELVLSVVEWLTEAVAFVISQVPDPGVPQKEERTGMLVLEKGLADRTFRLIQSVLRLGVTKQAQCYDRTIVSKHLDPVLEVAEVIATTRKKG